MGARVRGFCRRGKAKLVAGQGLQTFPVVAWAERGGKDALGPGNSVPRFHITWGTGPGLVEIFARRVLAAVDRGQVRIAYRHQVDELVVDQGAVVGVRGRCWSLRRPRAYRVITN